MFIPILPKTLIEFVEAPMPFLIGVLSSLQTLLLQREIEQGTVIYHLDEATFLQEEYSEFIPKDLSLSISRNLNKLVSSDISKYI